MRHFSATILRRLTTQPGLVRAIGTTQLTAGVVNATVGAGIFVLPALVASGLGSASLLAYLACAAVMSLVVLCAAAAGSRIDATGGMAAYVAAAFGPRMGAAASATYWISAVLGASSVASALADTVATVWAPMATEPTRAAVLAVLLALLARTNIRGVGQGAQLVQLLTVSKLAPLALLIVAGARFIDVSPSQLLPLPSAAAVGSTSLVLVFAFVGCEVALVPSGEIRNPSQTVPRGLLLGLGATTIVYLLVQAVAQGVLGASLIDFPSAPLAEVGSRLFGRFGGTLVLLGAAVSMVGYLSGDMLGTPRTLLALSELGMLPAAVGRIHPRFLTPSRAIVIHALVVYSFAATGTFLQLVVLASAATLLLYLMMIAASWELQRRDVRVSSATGASHPFVLPIGPLVPILGALAVLWLLAQTAL